MNLASISRTSRAIARWLWRAVVAAPGRGMPRDLWVPSAGMATGTARRALCIAVDISNWSGRLVPEQVRAQHALVTTVRTACVAAGLPREFAQVTGDGVLITAPSGIDETRVIPDLIQNLKAALSQENRMLSEGARIRLRMALTEGMIVPGPAGFGGRAVVECFRLLDSPPVRQALDEHPPANLAVIVSDGLYHDVVGHDFPGLQPSRFKSVDCSIPGKGFRAHAWVDVPGQ